ncbi:MAG: hypothetical protein LQ344_000637 [Seirophora lacunosa]|nr:MAG: hypothetical protein LQ344_000637 [Seirophora lacunosa]
MNYKLLKAAILIVSDTASQDPSTDKAGPLLRDVFAEEEEEQRGDQWTVSAQRIVPDDVLAIQRQVTAWCDDGGDDCVNLVLTTGGTGFTGKDNTPEAVVAVMSRPVAGVRNKTIIITLPGSPKGAKENLLSILKQLPHACKQAAGEDSRVAHAGGVKALEQEARTGTTKASMSHHHHQQGHAHHHSHHGHAVPKAHTSPEDRPISNDPREGPTQRYRESPYPMVSVDEALELILDNAPQPRIIKVPVNGELVGHVLAEDVHAEEPVPAFRASIVDGYAMIVGKDAPSSKGTFPVASISHATPGEILRLEKGQVARITTGAPLPLEATSVVMVEDSVIRTVTENGKEEAEVEILTNAIKPGENVREIGSDVRAGEIILRKGEEITATGGELGLLASVGKMEVSVYGKPVVGVLSTGDEIVPHDRPGSLRLGEVRDTNRPTVMAAVRGWGFDVVDLGISSDSQTSLEASLRSAMRSASVIITTGGVSMGELDLLKPTIERSLGGTIHFGRVAMKPGKPTTFATVPFKTNTGEHETRLIFSLPGNPASAIVTSHLFVLPALRKTSGGGLVGMERVVVSVEEDVACDPKRSEYHRVVIRAGRHGGLWAASTGGQRSSRVGSLKSANGLLCMPAREGKVGKGEKVEALLMGKVTGF